MSEIKPIKRRVFLSDNIENAEDVMVSYVVSTYDQPYTGDRKIITEFTIRNMDDSVTFWNGSVDEITQLYETIGEFLNDYESVLNDLNQRKVEGGSEGVE